MNTIPKPIEALCEPPPPSAGLYASDADFRKAHRPRIRPKGTEERLRRAMEVDASFLAEFEALRAYLRPVLEEWPESLLSFLQRHPECHDRLEQEAVGELRRLVKAHSVHLAQGRFDAAYLDTLEDFALFFIRRDIKSIYLAGAYQAITARAIDLALERAKKRGAHRVPQLIQTLIATLSLELNQIQRVFIVHERARYEDLLVKVKVAAPELLDEDAEAPPAELELPAEDVELAAAMVETLLRQKELLPPAFLKRLGEIDPSLETPPGADLAALQTEIAALLDTVLTHLDAPHVLTVRLKEFAALRPGLAASETKCENARRAMLSVFQRAGGLAWTEQNGEAWRRIFDRCAEFVRRLDRER